MRVRASAGRAFRVPSFTERFYSDPANLARADVGPEHAWSGEVGMDLFVPNGWVLKATVFGRADSDVIDWLRATTAERWQTYNIRDVDTKGVEVGVRRNFSREAFLLAEFTALDLDAPAVTQLSKYALDYAPRSLVAAAAMPLVAGLRVAPRVEYRRRSRVAGDADYVLLDVRLGRRFGSMLDVFVDGLNLFDQQYEEIAGVPMPGAAMMVSIAVGR